MAYFKKNSNQTIRPGKAGRRSKQDRRWTLLFIGNHGKTITFRRFKGMVILAFTFLILSIGVSVGLFAWNMKTIMDKHALKAELKKLNHRIDTLRHDKDILMTRLVVAESKARQSSESKAGEAAPEISAANEQDPGEEKTENPRVDPDKTEPPSPGTVEPRQGIDSADTGLSVAVEDFQISNRSEDNRLKVMFKVKNTSPNSRRVSGHTIIVMKGEQTNWVPIPWVPLVDGRPTGERRGHSFGINYFKTMRLSTRAPKSPEKFQTATVFVFTREGELLLEKDYPVKLPPNKPIENKPAASVHALPVESSTADSPAAAPAETPSATEILGLPSSDVPPGIPTATDTE